MSLDGAMVAALVADYRSAPLEPRDRAMLDFVTKLTCDGASITPADHAALRSVGFDDRGILQITLIAAWFNYINRIADALGVGRGTNPSRENDSSHRAHPNTEAPSP